MDRKSKPHGHSLRIGRVSMANQIYSVTTVTKSRQPFFEDLYAARALIKILHSHETMADAHTMCFVVMPDHLHWLLQLKTKKDLSTTVPSVKSRASKALRQTVWHKGFHDRAVRRDDDVVAIARYIIADPIRVDLSLREYPH